MPALLKEKEIDSKILILNGLGSVRIKGNLARFPNSLGHKRVRVHDSECDILVLKLLWFETFSFFYGIRFGLEKKWYKKVSDLVPKKVGIEKKSWVWSQNIWYRKNQILGLVTHINLTGVNQTPQLSNLFTPKNLTFIIQCFLKPPTFSSSFRKLVHLKPILNDQASTA